MHCKSAEELDVKGALAPCANSYLGAILAASPATVIVVAGTKAAKAIALVFGVRQDPGVFGLRQDAGAVVGPERISGIERLLLYLPHPGWLRRNPKKAEALQLPKVVSATQLEQLQTLAAAAS